MINDILNFKEVNPYYIYAPPYNACSAGIKAMHLLCHHLNLMGYPAFLIRNAKFYNINSNLITPILEDKVLENHLKQHKNPITVYADTIKGNPINAKCVVRYLLHYAGFLGGDDTFPKEDIIFSYTKKIAEKSGFNQSQILFMPVSDTKIFYPPPDNSKRSGSCFYASKYRCFFKGELLDITKNSIEITRDLPDSQTTEEVADLLRKSEVFYCYEDSSLITEANLCGCSVILIKNEFFSGKTLAEYELGTYDCHGDIVNGDVLSSKERINLAQDRFQNAVDNFWSQLQNFIQITQTASKEKHEEISIKLPKYKQKVRKFHIGRAIRKLFFIKF